MTSSVNVYSEENVDLGKPKIEKLETTFRRKRSSQIKDTAATQRPPKSKPRGAIVHLDNHVKESEKRNIPLKQYQKSSDSIRLKQDNSET